MQSSICKKEYSTSSLLSRPLWKSPIPDSDFIGFLFGKDTRFIENSTTKHCCRTAPGNKGGSLASDLRMEKYEYSLRNADVRC